MELINNPSCRRRHLHRGFDVGNEPGTGTETRAPMSGLPMQSQWQATRFGKSKPRRPIPGWKASTTAAVFTDTRLLRKCEHTNWNCCPHWGSKAQTPHQHVQTTECSVLVGVRFSQHSGEALLGLCPGTGGLQPPPGKASEDKRGPIFLKLEKFDPDQSFFLTFWFRPGQN